MEEKILFEGKYLRVCAKAGWEYVQRNNCSGVVVILPVTERGETVFVEQFRVPVGKRVIEFPAGLVGDKVEKDESMELAASRELEEETGYRSTSLKRLITAPPSVGLSSEFLTFYLATNIVKVGDGGGDESESIRVHVVPLNAVQNWLNRKSMEEGLVIDLKVYAGLYWLSKEFPLNQ